MAKVIKFPPGGSGASRLVVYVLNVWDARGFWGALGVYTDASDAECDAKLVMGMNGMFVKYRIEVVNFVPNS